MKTQGHPSEANFTLIKLSLTVILLLFALEMFLPYRAFTDEISHLIDIVTVVNNGRITTPRYRHGTVYATSTSILIIVLGQKISDLQVLSPVISSILLSASIGGIWSIVKLEIKSARKEYAIILFLTPFLLPGFINRLRITTHVAYTTVFVIFIIYTSYLLADKNMSYKNTLLLIILSIALSQTSQLWAFVYLVPIVLFLVLTSLSSMRKTGVPAALSSLIIVWLSIFSVMPVWSPRWAVEAVLIPINRRIYSIFGIWIFGISKTPYKPIGGGELTVAGSASVMSKISNWPIIEVSGFTLSVWWIHSMGVVFSLLVVAVASSITIYKIRCKESSLFDILFMSFVLWFTILVFITMISSEYTVLKRLAILPTILATCAFITHIEKFSDGLTSIQKINILTVILILFILFALLSAPKVLIGGGYSPYDKYGQAHELHEADWYRQNTNNYKCVYTNSKIDRNVITKELVIKESKTAGRRVPFDPRPKKYGQLIYSNGYDMLRSSCI